RGDRLRSGLARTNRAVGYWGHPPASRIQWSSLRCRSDPGAPGCAAARLPNLLFQAGLRAGRKGLEGGNEALAVVGAARDPVAADDFRLALAAVIGGRQEVGAHHRALLPVQHDVVPVVPPEIHAMRDGIQIRRQLSRETRRRIADADLSLHELIPFPVRRTSLQR